MARDVEAFPVVPMPKACLLSTEPTHLKQNSGKTRKYLVISSRACSEGPFSGVLPYFVMSQRPVLYSISSKKLVRLNQTKVAMPSLNYDVKYTLHLQKYELTNRKRLFRTTSGLPQEKVELVRYMKLPRTEQVQNHPSLTNHWFRMFSESAK